jgi:restriction endonuclease S subunit
VIFNQGCKVMQKVRLDKIASLLFMGYLFPSRVEHDPSGTIQVVQMRNIGDGELNLTEPLYIQPPKNLQERYQLRRGDILFRARNIPNTAAMVEEDLGLAIAASPIIIIRVASEVDPGYLVWFLNHSMGQSQLQRKSQGTNLQMVNMSALEAVEIDLPPLKVQHQIAEVARLQRQERKLVEQIASRRQQYLDAALMQCTKNS